MEKIKSFIGSKWGKFAIEAIKVVIITAAHLFAIRLLMFDVQVALLKKFNLTDIQMYRAFMTAMDTESGQKITKIVACATLGGIGLPILYAVYMTRNIIKWFGGVRSERQIPMAK